MEKALGMLVLLAGMAKANSFTFYFHHTLIPETGRAASSLNLARATNLTNLFGFVVLFDNKLTFSPDFNSKQVGRARGLYVGDSMADYTSFLALFTAELDLNGKLGTLCFFGQDRFRLPVRDISVFGCGGAFKGGPEIATVSTFNSSQRFNVVLKIYVPLKALLRDCPP